MTSTFASFTRDETGLESIEYGLMTAFIVVGILGALGTLTTAIVVGFERIASVINILP